MKKGTLTVKEMERLYKQADRYKERQFLIVFCNSWPFITIHRVHSITISEDLVKKFINKL